MPERSVLVGRAVARAQLEEALDRARLGEGSFVLLSGEAGVGKTRLAGEVASAAKATVLTGTSSHSGTAPYGPVVTALRSYLRAKPGGLDECGPLRPHLAMLLPELGEAAPATDRATLFEAVRCALAHVARDTPALVVLDDLQWSDEATLELLSALAATVADLSLLVVGAYRSDGLPRQHGLRRLRNELRRAGRLEELTLEPLDVHETGELVAQLLGDTPAPSLVQAIHDRTQGVPFFVEELSDALRVGGRLTAGRRGLELAGDDEVPLPETVRDAVAIGTSELSDDARAAAEVAAVAGESFPLEVVAGLSDAGGLAELLEHGLLREQDPGRAGFRHALAREAVYADVPWIRRRALHRQLAEALEAAGAPSREVATHWLGAREDDRAREALLQAAAQSEALHAYRDAAQAGRQALELWPEQGDEDRRNDSLERYARCCELSGDLPEAARGWRELSAIRSAVGDQVAMADAQRRLAAVHELKGDRDAAYVARRLAADAYVANGQPGDAAVEHLAMANQMRLTAKHTEAMELARAAGEEASAAGRLDLRVRALGLEGLAQAKQGDDYEGGLETLRSGLALALEHDLTAAAAELYQRLSVAIYESADYRRAQDALDTALRLCSATGDEGLESACVTCMIFVLRERGEWPQAAQMSRELIDAESSVWVAQGLLGAIHCHEGKLSSARRLLTAGHAAASRIRHYNMTVDTVTSLARVAAAEGATDEARERCREFMARWRDSDDHHYAVPGFRWAATFFAGVGDVPAVHECADALAEIASETAHPDGLAALAATLGEVALRDGDVETAAEQLSRAVEIHRGMEIPFEQAQVELRAGIAMAAAGEREMAVERLSDAYRIGRKLGARPLAAEAAREVAALGESVAERLGARAEADADGAGLSRRELEVVRLLAVGRTNREIAGDLFLSQRTVDMHVRNILRKLDCRSRVEAAHRAGELGLLA
jgi:DNA-binding CsgD family transcriptional regulator